LPEDVDVQRVIAETLDRQTALARELSLLHRESATEIEALLPSTLDALFKPALQS
jgi:hypothetical protein